MISVFRNEAVFTVNLLSLAFCLSWLSSFFHYFLFVTFRCIYYSFLNFFLFYFYSFFIISLFSCFLFYFVCLICSLFLSPALLGYMFFFSFCSSFFSVYISFTLLSCSPVCIFLMPVPSLFFLFILVQLSFLPLAKEGHKI